MARKKSDSGVNKSEAIREILKGNPKIKASEAIATLKEKGVEVAPGLFYLVKGKIAGRKARRKKNTETAVKVATGSGNGDAVKTILKVKALATELGGLRHLKSLVDALSE